MTFHIGRKSRNELAGVHADIVRVVELAIELTEQDFVVHDGIRTLAEQSRHVAAGVSRTMKSRHLPGQDGMGHAVDLVPIVNGKLRWEWLAIYPIAEAMREAARECGIQIVWGGSWGRLDVTVEAPDVLVRRYVDVRRAHGKSAFIDGPHFELPKGVYPC